MGIERVVPQAEKGVFRSYKQYFKDGIDDGWYKDVQEYVGRILGKNYSEFKIKKAGAYKLQLVKETGITYSGFNMGAGEKALFELFAIIHECSMNLGKTLLIIDEIELGLHEIAQRKLITVLKDICFKYKMQIICTTHSPAVLESLPPEGRIYIDKVDSETIITKGISGAFAAGRLSDSNSNELDIFVEDEIAKSLLSACFVKDLRQRIGILPIGSHSAVCRQLASAYKNPKLKNKSIAIFDGDQRVNLINLINKMISDLELSTDVEKSKFKEWVKYKIYFLPSNLSPEKWIMENCVNVIDAQSAKFFGVTLKFFKQELSKAVLEPPHEEFFYLSKQLTLDEDQLIDYLTRLLASSNLKDLEKLIAEIKLNLD